MKDSKNFWGWNPRTILRAGTKSIPSCKFLAAPLQRFADKHNKIVKIEECLKHYFQMEVVTYSVIGVIWYLNHIELKMLVMLIIITINSYF